MKIAKLLLGAALMASGHPAAAEWHEAKSRHFVVYSDDKPEKLREFAEKLERFDAAVRMIRGSEDPAIGDGLRLTVFVLDNQNAVSNLAVGGSSDIAGFYVPRASRAAAFVPRRSGGNRRSDLDADTVFFHEYAHHLMFQDASGSYPRWLVEGFAEFFSRPEFNGDTVRLGTPAQHRADGLMLLGKPSIFDLVGETLDPRSGEQTEMLYGRGWLLTHYLTFEESRSGQMRKYLDEIAKGRKPIDAATTAFGDLRALDHELDRYLRINRFTHLNIEGPSLAANAASVKVRRLRAGEAAIMKARIRSERGVNEKTAPAVAELARRIAANHHDDPVVQEVLAEAEYDAGNHQAAIAAADRALARNPDSSEALLYKGRALMALAEKDAGKADWNAIQSLFMKANRLDREDPEPLTLFYETFAAAGKPATNNAVEGLLYAQLLAPGDARLRYMAATELVYDNKLTEARNLIQPLLMKPHADDKERARVSDILASFDSRDKAVVLAALTKGAGEEKTDEGSDD